MKKINSIGYGPTIVAVVFVLLLALPGALALLNLLLRTTLLRIIIRVSLGLGLVLLLGFAVLLAVEFRQDARINREYQTLRRQKRQTALGAYECQACGFTGLSERDTFCPCCHMRFTK